jgi:ATP-dependent helicase/nuclease subunit B
VRIAAFPAEAAFLPALAKAWLAEGGDVGAGLLILPNRRAARALAGAFLQANNGQALLLPRIIAPGALDETSLALTAGLELPPAVPAMARQAMLAKLILARNGRQGAPTRLHTAWALAGDLAALLDEADTAEIDLRAALPGVVAAELASHWQTTLAFLEIVTHAWPKILADLGMVNPAWRQRALLDAQTAAWENNPPVEKIWLVARDASPALARLARIAAGLPDGAVVLPGYDFTMDEAAWEAVTDSHPQMGIARLLGTMGVRQEEVQCWESPPPAVPPGRAALLSAALLPAARLQDWQNIKTPTPTQLSRLQARGEQEDATAIAMVLREALEQTGRTAALITPDRALARRVAAALQRFGVVADDSAGEAVAETPPAVFLRLLARAAVAEFAPLPLLALLKHPLTAVGLPPELAREQARSLEQAALRGPRPGPGFDGIKFRLETKKKPAERDFVARLETLLKPVTGLPEDINPAAALRALLHAGEALAATAETPGAARLWAGEAGTVLSETLIEALAVLQDLPDIKAADLPGVLDAVLAKAVVRKPRTRDGHPRIAIWGVQEASLQTVDVAVLGGLVEGVWPAAAEPGPWLSRPMRKAAGLPAAEEKIGQAAHDFFSLCCRCPTVVLAAPVRRARAPAIPARWITRLDALLLGAGTALPRHDAGSWAVQLDTPETRILRPRTRPSPPASARLREMSISGIATLIADPYAIYAGKILRIEPKKPLDEETDQSLFGEIVHAGLAAFFTVERDFAAPDAAAGLTLALQTAMRESRPRAALQHWWEARLERIAAWIVEAECERRRSNRPVHMALEREAKLAVAGGFTLTGRADRIERRGDGSVFIMDYKTGNPPSPKQVEYGSAPQLPLEAVMAEAGAFGADLQGEVTELAFWKLSGRHVKGEDKPLFAGRPEQLRGVIDGAAANLPKLFARYADAATPFLASPHPGRSTYEDVYKGMSRRGEWGGDGGDDDGD